MKILKSYIIASDTFAEYLKERVHIMDVILLGIDQSRGKKRIKAQLVRAAN